MTPKRISRVEVWGAAKVNIGWWVGERRADGFHDVCGLLQTISLTDHLEITVSSEGDPVVRLEVPNHPGLEDESNLVHRAAELLSKRTEPPPTKVRVTKSIPVGAGLGGGSADAAAALVGLNTLWRARRTPKQLLELAAEVGSDVPGILMGGLVHVSGRGERVRSAGAASDGWFVLGVSSEQIRAVDAYDAFDAGARADRGGGLHHNDLETAACTLTGDLGPRLDAMRRAAGIAFVTGSGPTVVGVAADGAHARGIAARVRPAFADVLLAQPISWGVRLAVGSQGRN